MDEPLQKLEIKVSAESTDAITHVKALSAALAELKKITDKFTATGIGDTIRGIGDGAKKEAQKAVESAEREREKREVASEKKATRRAKKSGEVPGQTTISQMEETAKKVHDTIADAVQSALQSPDLSGFGAAVSDIITPDHGLDQFTLDMGAFAAETGEATKEVERLGDALAGAKKKALSTDDVPDVEEIVPEIPFSANGVSQDNSDSSVSKYEDVLKDVSEAAGEASDGVSQFDTSIGDTFEGVQEAAKKSDTFASALKKTGDAARAFSMDGVVSDDDIAALIDGAREAGNMTPEFAKLAKTIEFSGSEISVLVDQLAMLRRKLKEIEGEGVSVGVSDEDLDAARKWEADYGKAIDTLKDKAQQLKVVLFAASKGLKGADDKTMAKVTFEYEQAYKAAQKFWKAASTSSRRSDSSVLLELGQVAEKASGQIDALASAEEKLKGELADVQSTGEAYGVPSDTFSDAVSWAELYSQAISELREKADALRATLDGVNSGAIEPKDDEMREAINAYTEAYSMAKEVGKYAAESIKSIDTSTLTALAEKSRAAEAGLVALTNKSDVLTTRLDELKRRGSLEGVPEKEYAEAAEWAGKYADAVQMLREKTEELKRAYASVQGGTLDIDSKEVEAVVSEYDRAAKAAREMGTAAEAAFKKMQGTSFADLGKTVRESGSALDMLMSKLGELQRKLQESQGKSELYGAPAQAYDQAREKVGEYEAAIESLRDKAKSLGEMLEAVQNSASAESSSGIRGALMEYEQQMNAVQAAGKAATDAMQKTKAASDFSAIAKQAAQAAPQVGTLDDRLSTLQQQLSEMKTSRASFGLSGKDLSDAQAAARAYAVSVDEARKKAAELSTAIGEVRSGTRDINDTSISVLSDDLKKAMDSAKQFCQAAEASFKRVKASASIDLGKEFVSSQKDMTTFTYSLHDMRAQLDTLKASSSGLGAASPDFSKATASIQRYASAISDLQTKADQMAAVLRLVASGDIKMDDAEIRRVIDAYGGAKTAASNFGNAAKSAMKDAANAVRETASEVEKMKQSIFSSGGVWSSIKSAASDALDNVKTKLAGAATQSKALEVAMKAVVSVAQTLGSVIKGAFSILGNVLSGAVRLVGNLASGLFNLAKSAISSVINAAKRMGQALVSAFNGAVNAFKKIGESVWNYVTAPFRKAISAFDKLKHSIMRITFYRAVRGAFQLISKGIQEGVDNLYQFSRAANTDFAPAMDSLASSMAYMRNSAGAMAGPLIQSVAPAVNYLIDLFVQLLNVINMVFAVLGGSATYTRAVRGAAEYGEDLENSMGGAAGSAKELRRYLIGIDELNVIPEQNKGGGGGGGGDLGEDFGSMFEEVPIDGWVTDIVELIRNGEWGEAGKALAESFNELVQSMLDEEGWFQNGAKQLFEKLYGMITLAADFLRDADFTRFFTAIFEAITASLENLKPEDIGALMAAPFTLMFSAMQAALDTDVIPAALEKIAPSIDGFFTSLAKKFESAPGENDGWKNIGANLGGLIAQIVNGIATALDGVNWDTISSSLKQFWEGLRGALTSESGGINWESIWGALGNTIGGLAGTIVQFIPGDSSFFTPFEILKDRLYGESKVVSWGDIFDALETAFASLTLSIIQWVDEHFNGGENAEAFGNLQTDLKNDADTVDWSLIFGALWTTIGDIGETLVEKIQEPETQTKITEAWTTLRDTLIQTLTGYKDWEELKGAIGGVLTEIWNGALDFLYEQLKESHPHIAGWLFPGRAAIDSAERDFLEDLNDVVLTHDQKLSEAGKTLMNAIERGVITEAQAQDIARQAGYEIVNGTLQPIEDATQGASETSQEYIDSLWNPIIETTDGASSALSGLSNTVNQITFAPADTQGLKRFRDDLDGIGLSASNASSEVGTSMDEITNAVTGSNSTSNSDTATNWDAIKSSVVNACNNIRSIISSSWTIFNNVIKGKNRDIASQVDSDWNSVKNNIVLKMTDISVYLGVAWSDIASSTTMTLTNMGTDAANALSTMGQSLAAAIEDTKGKLSSALSGMKNDVTVTFTSLKSSAYNWGADICKQLASGMNDNAWRVRSAASSIAQGIRDYLHFSVPDKGPLSDADEYAPDLVELLAEGIKSNQHIAVQAVSEMAEKMRGEFESPRGKFTLDVGKLEADMRGSTERDYEKASSTRNIEGESREDKEEIINAIYAIGNRIIRAINENGGDVYMDGTVVGRRTREVQNRDNRIYGKTLQNT